LAGRDDALNAFAIWRLLDLGARGPTFEVQSLVVRDVLTGSVTLNPTNDSYVPGSWIDIAVSASEPGGVRVWINGIDYLRLWFWYQDTEPDYPYITNFTDAESIRMDSYPFGEGPVNLTIKYTESFGYSPALTWTVSFSLDFFPPKTVLYFPWLVNVNGSTYMWVSACAEDGPTPPERLLLRFGYRIFESVPQLPINPGMLLWIDVPYNASSGNAACARYFGDEFGILIPIDLASFNGTILYFAHIYQFIVDAAGRNVTLETEVGCTVDNLVHMGYKTIPTAVPVDIIVNQTYVTSFTRVFPSESSSQANIMKTPYLDLSLILFCLGLLSSLCRIRHWRITNKKGESA
jgi:hypothetical protein